MNRLILVGNGFDLAHGLQTSYQNFIDDFWNNIIVKLLDLPARLHFENEYIIIKSTPSIYPPKEKFETYKQLKDHFDKLGNIIIFKNKFLEIVSEIRNLENWIDLENEYYKLLIDCLRERSSVNISELNNDFNKIKNQLIEYLTKIEKNIGFNIGISEIIFSDFNLKDFSEELINYITDVKYDQFFTYYEEINMGEKKYIDFDSQTLELLKILDENNLKPSLRKFLFSRRAQNFDMLKLKPEKICMLNFNYTDTPEKYINLIARDAETDIIFIHGNLLDQENNPIIFGFGDEVDKNYSSIEELNDNRYLDNIKSINYLQTDNYKRLLELINIDNYQVFIFGHSCGLSDRTMLNTIFENKNCHSIKVFYHQKNSKEDNYTGLVQNISRNFIEKTKMRDKVVNKKYSESLMTKSL